MQRLPGLRMCWILPGTSMDLNLAGRSAALCGMCRSPRASTSTILSSYVAPFPAYLFFFARILNKAYRWLRIAATSPQQVRPPASAMAGAPVSNRSRWRKWWDGVVKWGFDRSAVNRALGFRAPSLAFACFLGPLHTRDWGPVTSTLQPLSLLERRSRSEFASHYAWGTTGVSKCKMDVKCTWILTWHQMDHVSWSLGLFLKPPLRSRPNIKLGNHGFSKSHNHWFILFYHVWGPHINRNSLKYNWLRACSHNTSHYTWGHVTTLPDFGSALGEPLNIFFGPSQFHGHGSWFVCEVALRACPWHCPWCLSKGHFRWGPLSKNMGINLKQFEANWTLELDSSLDPTNEWGSLVIDEMVEFKN